MWTYCLVNRCVTSLADCILNGYNFNIVSLLMVKELRHPLGTPLGLVVLKIGTMMLCRQRLGFITLTPLTLQHC
ncbi:hypothetical protein MA16_Dca015642 [Dendrobium catenatum]|uniref:Uncharacterized protein n=1 Tax=Dendrobium catenatum TaxID=906689 RepID=A0A2I0VXL1_9ASPA|nr:hypothetical protein MA16_Dca015642 [Dendrobium catenatum]